MNWTQLLSRTRPGELSKAADNDADRSSFEQDYDRIIFSNAFRSLQDKTQVFPLPKEDFVHTRLTHSLEVASVGRSMGKMAGRVILDRHTELQNLKIESSDIGAVVAAAALMHDIGNPPFGHAGESAISEFFLSTPIGQTIIGQLNKKERSDLSNFEGNAQGFRIVNKPHQRGLRLTFATLGAFSKYPRESEISTPDTSRKSQKKYGFFQSNKNSFKEVAKTTGLIKLGQTNDAAWCRHPLAFLVEAADDICYSIIDMEDGTNLGLVPFSQTRELLSDIANKHNKASHIDRVNSLKEKTGYLRAMAISTLIKQTIEVFLDNETEMLNGNFDRAITDVIPAAALLEEIQAISLEKIYRSQPVLEKEVAGFEVLNGLMSAFAEPVFAQASGGKLNWRKSGLIRLLPVDTGAELMDKEPYEAMLTLLDFISGLTDSRALSLFRNIKGISLPGFD